MAPLRAARHDGETRDRQNQMLGQATRSRIMSGAVSDIDLILEIAQILLASPLMSGAALGITRSSLNTEECGQEPQLDLGP